MESFENLYSMYVNMDKNNKFLLSMIILIIFLLVLIVIISLISRHKEVKRVKLLEAKRQEQKKNFKENVKPIDFSEFDLEEDLSPTVTLNKNKIMEVKVEKPEEIEVLEEEQIQEEIEVMDEVADEIESIKKNIEQNLDNTSINLNKWEQEQEENAIISYDELVKRAGAKKIVYKEEPKKEEKKITKIYKPTEIVSPVYGVQQKIKEIDEKIESYNNIEKLRIDESEEEYKKDIDFLNSLKQIRSELN